MIGGNGKRNLRIKSNHPQSGKTFIFNFFSEELKCVSVQSQELPLASNIHFWATD